MIHRIDASALNNLTLHTRILAKGTNKKFPVDIHLLQINSTEDLESGLLFEHDHTPPVYNSNRCFIKMDSPTDSCLLLQLKDRYLGNAHFISGTQHIHTIENEQQNNYKYVGRAFIELTSRLTLLSGSYRITLSAMPSAKGFYFSLGFRPENQKRCDQLKEELKHFGKINDGYSEPMALDLLKKSSGPDSPRLMHEILQEEIEAFSL